MLETQGQSHLGNRTNVYGFWQRLVNPTPIVKIVVVVLAIFALAVIPGAFGIAGHFTAAPLWMQQIHAGLHFWGSITMTATGVAATLSLAAFVSYFLYAISEWGDPLPAEIPRVSESIRKKVERKELLIRTVERDNDQEEPRYFIITSQQDREFLQTQIPESHYLFYKFQNSNELLLMGVYQGKSGYGPLGEYITREVEIETMREFPLGPDNNHFLGRLEPVNPVHYNIDDWHDLNKITAQLQENQYCIIQLGNNTSWYISRKLPGGKIEDKDIRNLWGAPSEGEKNRQPIECVLAWIENLGAKDLEGFTRMEPSS